MFVFLQLLLIAGFFSYARGSDVRCENEGGICQEDNISCPDHYVSNLCDGHASRRCCIGTPSDPDCTNVGGKCQDDHLFCTGSYLTGKCSGGITNRCCTSSHTIIDKTICDDVKVISRDTWGARRPTHHSSIHGSVGLFFIHHTAGHTCHSEEQCANALKRIQNYHMNSRGYNDIGYSFLIGEDGRIYEGRGWGTVGAHTQNYNTISYAASFMGNYMDHLPSNGSLAAAKALIHCGVEQGYINDDYSLFGHRDVGTTSCPGTSLYAEINKWPHYNHSRSTTI